MAEYSFSELMLLFLQQQGHPAAVMLSSDQDAQPDIEGLSNNKDVKTDNGKNNKKLSYCWETVRRESMPRIAEMDVEMTI